MDIRDQYVIDQFLKKVLRLYKPDLSELLGGVFISGAQDSGKTNLAILLADYLMKNNIIVYVIDPSQVWEEKSSIPNCVNVEESSYLILKKESTIYDVSLLDPDKHELFVQKFCSMIYNKRAKRTPTHSKIHRPETFIIFEEAQLYLPKGQLQKRVAQELLRVISVGRNFNIRSAIITQFPSMVDRHAIKYCRSRFFGLCDDADDVEYLKPYVKDKVDRLYDLGKGCFICFHKGSCQEIKAELFKKP
ncbi:MAG: hypothetical protein OEY88_05145 [Candidatus Bathyarchaeota archaeon]|nr:hypothetical protein [Candidatus Bathyarchaeota archaeon]